jgi:hypothetical protein
MKRLQFVEDSFTEPISPAWLFSSMLGIHHSSLPASASRRWIGDSRKLMMLRVPVLISAVVAMPGAAFAHILPVVCCVFMTF